MGTIVAWILGIATLLGGVAAIVYLYEKRRERQKWAEKEKKVNNKWWESSELKKQYEAKGYRDFSWSNSNRVAERLAQGKEIVYEIDEKNRVKYKLVNDSGQVLLCSKGA